MKGFLYPQCVNEPNLPACSSSARQFDEMAALMRSFVRPKMQALRKHWSKENGQCRRFCRKIYALIHTHINQYIQTNVIYMYIQLYTITHTHNTCIKFICIYHRQIYI